VLLSGGLDSATILHMAVDEGFEVHAVSFQYGQQHSLETVCAKTVAVNAGVAEHRIVAIDPGLFEGSALTGGGAVPRDRSASDMSGGIPSTYVPARNTVFLAMALAYAEVIGSTDIFIGVNALDYSGYPDCRPEYITAFQRLAELATRDAVQGNPVNIHAPLLNMTKAEIIKKGFELGIDYSGTLSCYTPDNLGRACGRCDACVLRLKGFRENGLEDAAPYIQRES